jgi:hypothetical protein
MKNIVFSYLSYRFIRASKCFTQDIGTIGVECYGPDGKTTLLRITLMQCCNLGVELYTTMVKSETQLELHYVNIEKLFYHVGVQLVKKV